MTDHEPLPTEPLPILRDWISDAETALPRENPTAMTLATLTLDGLPDARMVICRGFDYERGWLVFYTDLRSAKARQLRDGPRAAAVFHWNALQRQIRIQGPVTLAPDSQSDAYFADRPAGSQVGAWVSHQSQPLESRELLEQRYREQAASFGVTDPDRPAQIPRPEFWGGYRLWIESIEFWSGRRDRLHDRAAYSRKLELDGESGDFTGSPWSASRLQP